MKYGEAVLFFRHDEDDKIRSKGTTSNSCSCSLSYIRLRRDLSISAIVISDLSHIRKVKKTTVNVNCKTRRNESWHTMQIDLPGGEECKLQSCNMFLKSLLSYNYKYIVLPYNL